MSLVNGKMMEHNEKIAQYEAKIGICNGTCTSHRFEIVGHFKCKIECKTRVVKLWSTRLAAKQCLVDETVIYVLSTSYKLT